MYKKIYKIIKGCHTDRHSTKLLYIACLICLISGWARSRGDISILGVSEVIRQRTKER